MKAPVSILVPTLNEAANLDACLATCAFADQVVVVDSRSTDATREIALRHGAEIVEFTWDGRYPKKKNWALQHVAWRHEWVFILDADERIPPALAAEIDAIARASLAPDSPAAYFVNRRFRFMDGWLNHCGYYPSWNIRLLRHRLCRFEKITTVGDTRSGDNEVHEHVEAQGSVARLSAEMEHHAFPDIHTWVEKHNRYSNWEAEQQLAFEAEGADPTPDDRLTPGLARKRRLRQLTWRLPFRPLLRFLYHYVIRLGFLDGYRGFVFCRLMGVYEFLNATKTAELRRQRARQP